MDTTAVFFEGIRIVFIFLLFLFIPGFALSLVIFPRSTDLSIIDRLVYSTVLSISSSIASLVFMDIVLGFDLMADNYIFVISVFSGIVFLFWVCERWYLNSRIKKPQEPLVSEEDQNLQKYRSREINAGKDQFRQDTQTVVVYHESGQSGINLIDHSFLIDVGDDIDIQQVSENKLDVTDSFVVDPPYPKTRYFELVLREYNEEGLSQVDDLQIYPVFVTKDSDRRGSGTEQEQDTIHITERIYQKTSTTEVQWIYSHDFHIFAIIHEEDTLDQMVDRILGKLDEIVTSTKSGIHIPSDTEDRQILRDAFDTVIKMPRGIPVKPPDIPLSMDVQPFVSSKGTPKRPVILPDIQHEKIAEYPDVLRTIPEGIPERPISQTGTEPEETPQIPDIQPPIPAEEIPERPILQTGTEPEETPQIPDIQPPIPAEEIPERPVVQTRGEPKKIPARPEGQPRVLSKKDVKRPENKLVVDSIRKLQKDILRDLDMFGLTSDSFKKSGKNIENIPIPKKADVNKKLAKAREDMIDLDWLYE